MNWRAKKKYIVQTSSDLLKSDQGLNCLLKYLPGCCYNRLQWKIWPKQGCFFMISKEQSNLGLYYLFVLLLDFLCKNQTLILLRSNYLVAVFKYNHQIYCLRQMYIFLCHNSRGCFVICLIKVKNCLFGMGTVWN